jgi:predicted nucleic acid-binding protein
MHRPGRGSTFEVVQRGQAWLSAVVVAELYAGSRSAAERFEIQHLVHGAGVANRLLVPTQNDWIRAGTLVARRVRLFGSMRVRDHLADVLILLAAAHINGEVLTANVRHFEAWARLARRAGLDVTVAPIAS